MSKFDPKRTLNISRRMRFFFFQSKCEVAIRFVVWEENKSICLSDQSFSIFVFFQLDYSDQSNRSIHWHPQSRMQVCFWSASSKSVPISWYWLWKGWRLTAWVLLLSCNAGNKKKKSQHLASSQTKLLSPFHPRKKMPSQGAFQDICLLDGT